MPKYLVTTDSTRTATYSFEMNMSILEFREWARDNSERFDKMTNPIREKESVEIVDVDIEVVMSKTEAYDKLIRYIAELTENEEPLELIKMLKPTQGD